MKQMMLNDGKHDVADIRGKLKKGNEQLLQDYTRASDLNGFPPACRTQKPPNLHQ